MLPFPVPFFVFGYDGRMESFRPDEISRQGMFQTRYVCAGAVPTGLSVQWIMSVYRKNGIELHFVELDAGLVFRS